MPERTSEPSSAMVDRLFNNWVYGGALAGLLLLSLAPLLAPCWPLVVFLTFLHLPVYMLHQYEEHDDDRFRRYVNLNLGKGKELLTGADVFVINIPGVWGVIAIALYLAAKVNLGFALIAVYLVLINGVGHIANAIALRAYNPGLYTALFLFLPFGAYSLWQVQRAGAGALQFHIIGLVVAIGVHAAILIHANRRRLAPA